MMDAKYAVGSKYWRVQDDLWVMTKEGNIKEVPGVGVFGGDDVGMWIGNTVETLLTHASDNP